MVDRHFSTATGDEWRSRSGYVSTGGTRLREAPAYSPRNYFADEEDYGGTDSGRRSNYSLYDGVRYYDSGDWYRPRPSGPSASGNAFGTYGSIYTGDQPSGFQPPASSPGYPLRWYNYGNPEQSGPVGDQTKGSPFACIPLETLPNSPRESTVTDLGNANKCFDQVTFKLLNLDIIPGFILHGIVYFDVIEDVRINKITLNGICNVHKDIRGKEKLTTDTQVSSFRKDIVSSTGGANKRMPSQYQALTEDWNGDDLMQALQLPEDYFDQDFLEWPFAGPITLNKGTHAIPFAIRIPGEVNPTMEYSRRGDKRDKRATVNHTTAVGVQVDAQPAGGSQLMTVLSDKLALNMQSCGGLPPVVNGMYAPGCVQQVYLGQKDARAIIIVEQKHVMPGDKLRVVIYSDKKDAVKSAFAELLVSTNLPEIGLFDTNDVVTAKKEPGIELLDKTSKSRFKTNYKKTFISKVGDKFPPNDTNYTPQGRLRPNMDDKKLMPESARQAGCELFLKVPKETDVSIEAGENRIRHHVRVHINLHRQRDPVSQAQMITVAENLRHNYTVKYIKFVN